MQRRREQLTRRHPPEVSAASATTAALALLLAACCTASTAAPETIPTPPDATTTEVLIGSDLPVLQCKCFDDSFLNCSFFSLKTVTEELNSCSRNVSGIDVSHNQLESLDGINIWFGSELNASHNLITEIHFESLKSAVEMLDVSWNNVLTLDLEDMRSLRILNASHNRLERVQALPTSCDLEVLDVSSNLLVELPVGIKECRNLSVLNVFNNTLKTFPNAMFEEFLYKGIPGQNVLMVDLQGNDIPPNDKSLRGLVDNVKLNFSAQPGNCACAHLSHGQGNLILCLSTMCTNDTEYWTLVNGAELISVPTPFSSVDDTVLQTESTSQSDCGGTTVPTFVNNLSNNSTVPDEATMDTNPPFSTVSPTSATAEERPEQPGVLGNATRGGRAGGSHADAPLPPPATLPPRDTPPPPTEATTPPPDTKREGRKRRLWVTLALTVVVLAAAGLGVYVLVKLYRRRQRQLLEERSQRIPLQPLVATPRSLRAADDDFVP